MVQAIVCVCVCVRACVHACVCAFMHVCVHACVCVCIFKLYSITRHCHYWIYRIEKLTIVYESATYTPSLMQVLLSIQGQSS